MDVSGLGGFCPLPIRLGGSAEGGFTAEQHARMCADLAAVATAMPFAVITFTKTGSTFVVHSYRGQNGVGAAHAPALTEVGTGHTRLTFSAVYSDEYETVDPVAPRHVKVTGHGSTAVIGSGFANTSTPSIIEARTFTAAGAAVDAKQTVVVGCSTRKFRIDDYDGALDKENCRTEETPYAWAQYQDLTSGLGDGFTTERTGVLHARKMAIARQLGEADRINERTTANALPATAHASLGDWVKIMRLRVSGDTPMHQIRQRVAAQFEAAKGNSITDVDAACAAILGPMFVQVHRIGTDDLTDEPAPTYWPAGSAGPVDYDIGGGTWLTVRSHIVVEIQDPPDIRDPAFQELQQNLYRMLDDLMPAWCTFSLAVIGDGFTLDVDQLDYQGLT